MNTGLRPEFPVLLVFSKLKEDFNQKRMDFAYARVRYGGFQSSLQKDEVSLCAGLWKHSVILVTVVFKTVPMKSQREVAGVEPFSIQQWL